MSRYYDWYKKKIDTDLGNWRTPDDKAWLAKNRLASHRATMRAVFVAVDNLRKKSQKRRSELFLSKYKLGIT